MNKEDIIRMAREANNGKVRDPLETHMFFYDELERFAALVAAQEREACAKLCDARFMGDMNREDMEARRCAAAIRARGQA